MFLSVYVLLCVISFIVACSGTRYLITRGTLDIPNDRSSHTIPTPRGGGLSIVCVFLLSMWFLPNIFAYALPLTLGSVLIAGISYLDDLYSLSAKLRFCVQILVAFIGLYGFYSHWWALFALIAIIWSINLYNFMDGIDGLAGSQGIFVSLAGAGLSFYTADYSTAALLLLLASCIAGFLVWNWPPARIFMGDVGSCTLGFIFAIFTLHSKTPLFWLIIMAVFIFDATFTLIRRILRGEKWYAAHRTHIYQRLVRRGFSHQQVTLGILGFNIFVLLPLACLSI